MTETAVIGLWRGLVPLPEAVVVGGGVWLLAPVGNNSGVGASDVTLAPAKCSHLVFAALIGSYAG